MGRRDTGYNVKITRDIRRKGSQSKRNGHRYREASRGNVLGRRSEKNDQTYEKGT